MSRFGIPATGRMGFKHATEEPEKNIQEGGPGTQRWNHITDFSQMLINSRDYRGG